MKSPLSKTSFDNKGSDLAFTLNEEANKRIQNGEKVINVALGSFYDDNNKLISFSGYIKATNDNLNESSRKYAAIDGGEDFKKNVEELVFGEYLSILKRHYFMESCVSPGGTGALFLAIRNYVDDNPILIPSIGWSNYKNICAQNNKKYEEYNLFKESVFDMDDLLKKAEISLEACGYCTILINDPCQNPTGYSLDDKEIKRLINELNALTKKGTVNLILDVAYMSLAEEPRRFFKHFIDANLDFFTIVCFSASKLFGIYGYRLGAAICLTQSKAFADDFLSGSKSIARAVWSNCNHLAINAFNDFCKNDIYKEEFSVFVEYQRALLKQRYVRAREYFDKLIGGTPINYKEGFFLVYRKDNANAFAKELTEKNIFVLPLDDKYIRVSICCYLNKD